MINDIKVAFAFLTRIPIGHKPDISIQRSAVWFPFVGWVIGGVTGILYYFLSQGIPAMPAAAITILFSTLVTGGFHQDGLADTFDGLVGGWTPEDRLRILKDSRHGTYGVLSIVLQLIIQISLLSTLSPKVGALAIITTHSLGRCGVLGDVLGASEQIAESFILLYFVVVLTHSLWLSWLI